MAAKSKGRLIGFFKGVKAELKRVNWPNRKEVMNYTTVVIFVCTVVAIGIWIFDSIFRAGLNLFL